MAETCKKASAILVFWNGFCYNRSKYGFLCSESQEEIDMEIAIIVVIFFILSRYWKEKQALKGAESFGRKSAGEKNTDAE